MDSNGALNKSNPETEGHTIPWASFYDFSVKLVSFGKDRELRDEIIKIAGIQPGESVLDVGCGTGELTLAAKSLTGSTGEVHGLDASLNMIEYARQKAVQKGADIEFRVGLIENISFPDNHFDIVLSSLMMHHLPEDLKKKGLAEIFRVLAPAGRLLVVDIESTPGGSLVQRLSELIIQVHGGHGRMQEAVKKLAPFAGEAGFVNVETGRINRQFSFMKGEKPGTAG